MSSENRAEESGGGRGQPWRWWIAAAVVLLAGFWLRSVNYHVGYGHPDEAITVEVVGHMRKSGDWDTNWAKAPNLESGLRYDQYNFSSHLYATFAFYRFAKLIPGTSTWRDEDQGFWVYRFFSVLLAALAVGQSLRLGHRLGGGGVALLAAALVAVAPILVQDAHFSRPEAFVTALTLAAVALCWPRAQLSVPAVLGGAGVIGLLVACKISMLALGWLPLVPLLAAREGEIGRRPRWTLAAAAMAVLVAGFVAGVPGALVHPEVYIRGIRHLAEQYAGVHPPHSHLNGGPVADLMGRYFVATLGWPLVGFGFVGAAVLAVQRRGWELAVTAGPVVLFVGYFSTRGVFFERNVSHVVPLFLVLAALGMWTSATWLTEKVTAGRRIGPATGVALGLLALTVIQPLRVSLPLVQVGFSGGVGFTRAVVDDAMQKAHPEAKWWNTLLFNDGPLEDLAAHFKGGGGPVLLRVADFSDEWTAYSLPRLDARFHSRRVGEFSGIFADQPLSTLLTYHCAREYYYLVSGPK